MSVVYRSLPQLVAVGLQAPSIRLQESPQREV